jgi:hypothetical protein
MNVEETMVMVEEVTVCGVLVVDKDCLKADVSDDSVADASVVASDVASEVRSVVISVSVVGLADVVVRSSAAGMSVSTWLETLAANGRGE